MNRLKREIIAGIAITVFFTIALAIAHLQNGYISEETFMTVICIYYIYITCMVCQWIVEPLVNRCITERKRKQWKFNVAFAATAIALFALMMIIFNLIFH